MIGTGTAYHSGYRSVKLDELREYMRAKIECRYCVSESLYISLKKSVTQKVDQLNALYGGVPLEVRFNDPSLACCGAVTIIRGDGVSSFICQIPVYLLMKMNVEEGGASL